VVLQKYAAPMPVFRFLVPAFVVFMLLLAIYNYYYLHFLQKYNFWIWLRPLLLTLSIFGVFSSVPNSTFRGLTVTFGALLLILFQTMLGKYSENIQLNETLLIVFGFFTALSAADYYFPNLLFVYVIMIFLSTFITSRSFFELIPQNPNTKIIISLVLGFFACELFWTESFLPFPFSSLALILLSLYYFCLILSYYQFFNILSYQKIKFHLWLIIVCVVSVLLATPWSIQS
jgi:hypothetical protein